MKAFLKNRMLPILLLLSILFSVVSCTVSIGGADPSTCEHRDLNRDGYCDECGEKLQPPEPHSHTDADGNGICDECGERIADPEPCVHTDADGDGFCDRCGEKIPDPKDETLLYLTEGNAFRYTFVTTRDVKSGAMKKIDNLISSLKKQGIACGDRKSDASAAEVSELEIVVGSGVRNRPEMYLDMHDLGEAGWRIRAIGQKILIAGGTDDALCKALDYFIGTVLGYPEKTDLTVKSDLAEACVPAYNVTGITVAGVPLGEYTILADKTDDPAYGIATEERGILYTKTGIWLDIKDVTESVAHPFYIRTANDAGGTGFRAFAKDGALTLECAYSNVFREHASTFFQENFTDKYGELSIPDGFSYTLRANVVYYSDFGAKGDAETDDFNAIFAAHEFANISGQKVEPDENKGLGKTYYIGDFTKTIPVKTDVDWGVAHFVIDDSIVNEGATNNYNYDLFTIKSDYSTKTLGAGALEGISLKREDTNVGMTFDYDCMLRPTNADHKVYVRYGANQNNGSNQQEVILVDRDGNIDSSTPLLWDYEKLTSLLIVRIDDKPLTIEGGVFTTIANKCLSQYKDRISSYYFHHGINIARSNTTVKNVSHYVTGEPSDWGCSYYGFISVNGANHVTIDSCAFWGHMTYVENKTNSAGVTSKVSHGTYDTVSGYSNDVTWKNCTQNNSITDSKLWGIHASNFCKNLTLLDSRISRFDAHQGMWNATVKNSYLGRYLNCIGGGLLYCENTTVRNSCFVSLRSDYGSTWEGDATIINCTLETDNGSPRVFSGSYTAGWDFGYKTFLPQNIILDNFKYTKTNGSKGTATLCVFWGVSAAAATDPVNPYGITKSITFRNMSAIKTNPNAGTASDAFAATKIVVE